MAKVLPANAAQAFLDALESSQILPAETLAKIRQQFATADDPKAVARDLIKQGKITRWQAQQLLGGFTGLVVGNYKMLDQLGIGEMGRVYLAEHVQMQRKVALKVLARKHTSQPQVLRQLLAEARRVAAIEHPNISHIQDVNQDGERYFIVLEYVDAEDLQKQVQRGGKLAPEKAWNVIRQAAEGLAHAHSKNVIHGGLKPSNLLLDQQGNVKILDFGLAQLAAGSEAKSDDSVDQAAALAKLFRAPETTKHPADRLGDVYSLGASLYFLLTGKAPSEGPASAEKLAAADVPQGLADLCRRLMAANPTDRPQDNQALLAALDAARPQSPAAAPAKASAPVPKANAPAAKTAAAMPTAKPIAAASGQEPAAKAPPPRAKKPLVAKPLTATTGTPAVAAAAAAAAPSDTPAEPAAADTPFAGFAIQTKGKSRPPAPAAAAPKVPSAAPPPAKAAPPKEAAAKDASPAEIAENPTPAKGKKGAKAKGAPGNNLPLILAGGIGGGVLVLGAIIALVVFLMSGGNDEQEVAKADGDPAAATGEATPGAEANGEANPAIAAEAEANPVIEAEANPILPMAVAPAAEANPTPASPAATTEAPAPETKPEPAKTDSAKPEPEKTEPAKTEPAKTEPAKTEPPMVASVTPEKKPEPKPAPKPAPKPVGDPFVGFAKAVSLPKLPAGMSEATPEMLAPVVLGPCKVPDENTVIIIALKGGETAYSKGKMKFTLESGNGGTSLRDWDFKLEGGILEKPLTVATMSAKNDQLLFQWTPEGAAQAAAPYLCNCLLSMSAGNGKAAVALREPVTAEPIAISIEKRAPSEKFNIDMPPESKQLMFEIVAVEGDVPKVKYDNKDLVAEKDTTFFWVGNVETEMPLGMKIDTSVTNSGRTVQVVTAPHFKLEGMTRPAIYGKKDLLAFKQKIDSSMQVGNAYIQQAGVTKDAKKKLELNQQGSLLLEPAQKANAQFEQLLQLAKGLQTNGKIHFRIYASVEGDKLELVTSGASAPAAAPGLGGGNDKQKL